jgi:hypothetical protein
MKWRYKVDGLPLPMSVGEEHAHRAKLTEAGAEGWELVSVSHVLFDGAPWLLFHFKQPIKEATR